MIARALPVLLLTACAPTPAPEPVQPPPTCLAEKAQILLGKPATQELAAEGLRLTRAKTVRWMRPGMAVTMDYRADRLNILIDDTNMVTRLSCG